MSVPVSLLLSSLLAVIVIDIGACHTDTSTRPTSDAAAGADAGASAGLIDGRTPLEYYKSVCGFCHGDYRQGVAGPALVPSRLTQDRSVYAQTIGVEHREGFLPESAHVLSDAEMELLLDLILSPPPPPSEARWGEREIERSLRIVVADDELVSAPEHAAKLDNLMLVIERDAPKLAVIDGDRHELVAHAYTSVRAQAIVLHPLDPRWAYSLSQDGIVSKVDLYALRTTRSVRTGIDALNIAISDDGKHLAVGNRLPNSLVVLHADSLELERRIETTGSMAVPSSVGVVVDVAEAVGSYFIAVLEQAGEVWRIDYSQSELAPRPLGGLGPSLSDGFLSADNRRFYVESADGYLAVIDVETWELVDKLPSLQQPVAGLGARWQKKDSEYAASLRGNDAAVDVWELRTGRRVGHVSTAGPGTFLRCHPDSPYVWVDAYNSENPREVTVFDRDKPDYPVVAHIQEGLAPVHPEFTAHGRFVYVADRYAGVVRVYDARYDAEQGFRLEKTIPDLAGPMTIVSSARRTEQLGQ